MVYIKGRQLNYLSYEQSGELCQVSWQNSNSNSNNAKFPGGYI